MDNLQLDMFQTMALGVVSLYVGDMLNKKVSFLKKVCIPNPVTGGFVIAILVLILHLVTELDISFDDTLKDICMMIFFTTAGLQCNFKTIREGGKPLILMTILVVFLILCQNGTGIGLALMMGQRPVFGLASGSITMTGGHGTAGGFCSVLENAGLAGAPSVTMAAATFGLIAGSFMGGPLGKMLVVKYKLKPSTFHEALKKNHIQRKYGFDDNALSNISTIFITAGIGSILRNLLLNVGITVPLYFGSLIVAIIVRNISEIVPACPKLNMRNIISMGEVSLSLFLGMAIVSLRLWELASIALPLFVILSAQVVIMYLFARFLLFRFMGSNYDAAVLAGGFCGFGLGATPNALANMDAICRRYGYTPIPFIIITLVGAAFADIINISIVTVFLNLILG